MEPQIEEKVLKTNLEANIEQPKAKKKTWWIWLVLAILLIVGGGYYQYKNKQMNNLAAKLLDIKLTANEDKGVKEVLNYYGGVCEPSIGTSGNLNIKIGEIKTESNKTFTLKLSKSEIVEKLGKDFNLSLPASNVAYLFYKNLEEEKNNYSEIRVLIVLNDGTTETFTYPIDQLELVKVKMDIANKVVEFIKQKDYQGLKSIISKENPFSFDHEEFISVISEAELKLGLISGFLPWGFRIDKEYNALVISGATVREGGENMLLSIMMSQDINDKTFYNLAYEI